MSKIWVWSGESFTVVLQVVKPACSFHARVAVQSPMVKILQPDSMQRKLMTLVKVPRFPFDGPTFNFMMSINSVLIESAVCMALQSMPVCSLCNISFGMDVLWSWNEINFTLKSPQWPNVFGCGLEGGEGWGFESHLGWMHFYRVFQWK